MSKRLLSFVQDFLVTANSGLLIAGLFIFTNILVLVNEAT